MIGWVAALGVACGLTDDEITAVWENMKHLAVPYGHGPVAMLDQFRTAAREAGITIPEGP